MRLTQFTDYSLRVLMYLGARPGRRATVAEVCAAFDIKPNHLTKVVHFLGREGLLHNVRGRRGGLELARETTAIVVGEVVRLAERETLPAACFGDAPGACAIARICRLRGVLQEAVEAFYLVLDAVTLEELLDNRPAVARMLAIPLPAPDARGRTAVGVPAHGDR